MALLFAMTMFVSAGLLFVVQPMAAKALLPVLGGSAAVWTTCAAFFQCALLGGYVYAHVSARSLNSRRQALLHLGLMFGLLVLWPFDVRPSAISTVTGSARPSMVVIAALAATIGAPVFAVAALAPMLQNWFRGTRHPRAHDPYFLYAASNLGSLAGLVAYPFTIEPGMGLAQQFATWSVGYTLLAALTTACALVVWKSAPPDQIAGHSDANRPGIWLVLRWVVLAFVPSSWMLGVTSYITADIAPAPLLWVIPLTLYLFTFVLAFSRRGLDAESRVVRTLPWLVIAWALTMGLGLVQPAWVVLHLLVFFVGALACHKELARQRPPGQDLTFFYVTVALGGALGGAFNALMAPVLFDRLAEYPIAVVLGCLVTARDQSSALRMRTRDVVLPLVIFGLTAGLVKDIQGWSETALGVLGVMAASGLVVLLGATQRRRPVRFALGIGAVLLASGLADHVDGRILRRERSFFGVSRVTEVPPGSIHRLFHGNTLHGQQRFDRGLRREPLTYYHRTGPGGQLLQLPKLGGGDQNVAVVGLGAGSLAAYATQPQRWVFYEIDPVVARIAGDPRDFTFLSDSRARRIDIVLGDGRIGLQAAPAHRFALIVLDAFSSDAIPTHLLTREAFRVYLDKLAEGGLLACHITNRYLDLEPVVGAVASDAGLVCRARRDLVLTAEEKIEGKQPSIWAVLARHDSDLEALAGDPRWRPARVHPGERPWTDDFSGIAPYLIRPAIRPDGPRRSRRRANGGSPERFDRARRPGPD